MRSVALTVALFAFAFGCGGRATVDTRAQNGSGAASGSTNDLGTSGGISTSGGIGANTGAGGASTITLPTSGTGGIVLGSAGTGAKDAGIPTEDASQPSQDCGVSNCQIDADDIACFNDTQCTVIVTPNCGAMPAIGVNTTASVACIAPPCLPPGPLPSPPPPPPGTDAGC
ncbi:MAG TPA: hypothetical protein VGM44_13205, partial [Polyangiaceae bacterium]